MSDETGGEMRITGDWLEAAIGIGISLRLGGGTDRQWGVHFYLLHLSRLQYACELSFRRIEEATELVANDEYYTSMAGFAQQCLDIHAFLVSAHSYWRTLKQLTKLLRIPATCRRMR